MTDSLQPGALVDGRYALEHRLGEGGFGEVWFARDTRLSRRAVAIKFLKTDHVGRAHVVARFDAEADALAMLQHPNVVGVSDRGEWQGQRYLVTEFVEGESLFDWLEGYRSAGVVPELTEVRSLFDQICAGLGAAHEVRSPGAIVHRDLKPENVLIRRSGRDLTAKVLDFGIAQLGGRKTTQTGMLMGTPLYMSPEQAMGQSAAIGPWTDVFALAVLFVEMLTLRPQYALDESWWGTSLRDGASVRAYLGTMRDDVPSSVWDVMARALASRGAERYADAGALRDALRAAWAAPEADRALGPATTGTARLPFRGGPATISEARGPLPAASIRHATMPLGDAGDDAIATVMTGPSDSIDGATPLMSSLPGGSMDGVTRVMAPSPADKAYVAGTRPSRARPSRLVLIAAAALSITVIAAATMLVSRRPRVSTGERVVVTARDASANVSSAGLVALSPVRGNPELLTFLQRWFGSAFERRGTVPLDEFYTTNPRFRSNRHGATIRYIEQYWVRFFENGGTLEIDWDRSEWHEEAIGQEPTAASFCGELAGAEGPVLKVRAQMTEFVPNRPTDVPCQWLRGVYLLRLRRVRGQLRICYETWSTREGLCTSCPAAPSCQQADAW